MVLQCDTMASNDEHHRHWSQACVCSMLKLSTCCLYGWSEPCIYAVYDRIYVGMARTIYTRCIYGIFGREITKYTVIYGVYIRFWPTLNIWWLPCISTVYTPYIYIYIFWPTLVVCAFILTLATRMGHWECSLPVLRFYSSIVCELVRLNETGNTYHTPCMNVYIYIQEFPAKATVCCTL
jgi:hypothetical protein